MPSGIAEVHTLGNAMIHGEGDRDLMLFELLVSRPQLRFIARTKGDVQQADRIRRWRLGLRTDLQEGEFVMVPAVIGEEKNPNLRTVIHHVHTQDFSVELARLLQISHLDNRMCNPFGMNHLNSPPGLFVASLTVTCNSLLYLNASAISPFLLLS